MLKDKTSAHSFKEESQAFSNMKKESLAVLVIFIQVISPAYIFHKQQKVDEDNFDNGPGQVIRIKPAIKSASPCHMTKISLPISIDNQPYVFVEVNACSGSCLYLNIPSSNDTFISPLCRRCRDTGFVMKSVTFPNQKSNYTKTELKSVTGCKCQKCN
uniref:DAN domain-containing protein n=1 Tax=Clytia hemisphaerica TaxID=252671 RepID=A0A7M5V3N1_9CNID